MKINVQRHLKCRLWLLAEQNIRSIVVYSVWGRPRRCQWRCHFPFRPSTSTTDENIEATNKMILDNHRITISEVADDVGISFGSCQVFSTDVVGMKRAAAKIVPKLLNFEQKQHRMDIVQAVCWRRSTTIQICSKRSQLVTNHECMAMTLKPKPNHPNGSVQKSQDLFSSIAMAWCIINSCHKVVRSLRNTTLKLCADCAKQFVRNAQNCGNTNHGFCIMITHQLTYRCLCVSFCQKTKP